MIYPNRFDAFCLSLVIAAASVPVAAQSVQPPLRGPMTFEVFDMDGDGVVTEQEFQSVRTDRMAARAAQGAPMRGAANAPPSRSSIKTATAASHRRNLPPPSRLASAWVKEPAWAQAWGWDRA